MKERPLPLSEEVENFIWGEDAGFVEMYPKDGREMLDLDQFIGESLRVSREEFSDRFVPAVERLAKSFPESAANSLDSIYVREMVTAVPGMVQRTMQLTGLSAGKAPSNRVNHYLREAVRTYVFGFPQASIALSRAVLEQAVKESAQGVPDGPYLSDRIDLVVEEHDLDHALAELAKSVAGWGNRVLHERPASLSEAFEALANVRMFLIALYGDEEPVVDLS